MAMKKRMLYLSFIDWNWIKQRPQFIAEGLSDHFDVSVLYMFQNSRRKCLQKRTFNKEKVSPIYSIPFSGRVRFLSPLNRKLVYCQFAWHLKKHQPDYIYLTYPTQVNLIPADFTGSVIYDCMDNHAALAGNNRKEMIVQNEELMMKKADFVLVSSMNLRSVLLERYGIENESKIHLVRNGYSGNVLNATAKAGSDQDPFTISYVGTIGKWFNFDYVLKSLNDIPNLRYKLIGPVEVETPQHDRIDYVGTLEHHKLYDAVKDTDCLVMPFMVNDIVASVDPVKLYEYINYNMNILCVRYPEIERFEPFVHFYEDYDGYLAEINSMIADSRIKYSNDVRVNFLLDNNWESRVDTIISVLQS